MIKLIEGDCLESMKLIEGSSIDLVLVDPPYGVTNCKWDSIIPFDKMWSCLDRVCHNRTAIVMTSSQPFTSALIMSNPKIFRYCWIWDKVISTGFFNANRMPMRSHEDIVVFYKKLPTYNPQKTQGHPMRKAFNPPRPSGVYGSAKSNCLYESDERHPRSIQIFSRDNQSVRIHPTQKPVALMEYLIKTYSNVGDTVLDFTMGSGTTGVAAKNLLRNFIGIEKDQKYFNTAEERISLVENPEGFDLI